MAKQGIQISTGNRVYEYVYYTYGVVTNKGFAVTAKPNEHPFFEINRTDIEWDGTYEEEFPGFKDGDK